MRTAFAHAWLLEITTSTSSTAGRKRQASGISGRQPLVMTCRARERVGGTRVGAARNAAGTAEASSRVVRSFAPGKASSISATQRSEPAYRTSHSCAIATRRLATPLAACVSRRVCAWSFSSTRRPSIVVMFPPVSTYFLRYRSAVDPPRLIDRPLATDEQRVEENTLRTETSTGNAIDSSVRALGDWIGSELPSPGRRAQIGALAVGRRDSASSRSCGTRQ